jgi:hypothetical protein
MARSTVSSMSSMQFAFAAAGILAVLRLVPEVSAIVMVWLALARPGWSDRALWAAAMILTAIELAPVATRAFNPHALSTATMYPSPLVVGGLIAYGTWLFIVDRSAMPSWRKATLAILCFLGLAVSLVAPIFYYEDVRPIDVIGSLFFAASMCAFGIAAAERFGIDLFRRDTGAAE